MKKIMSIILSGLIAASLLAGCDAATTENSSNTANENQITETVEYTSLKEDETHSFDEELIEEDGTYKLKDITYETVSSKPITEKQTLEIKDLYQQSVDAQQEHTFTNSKGQEVVGKLSDISYSDTIITNRSKALDATTNSGYVTAQPTPENTKTVQYYDEQSGQTVTVTLPLTNFQMTTGYHWVSDVTIPTRFEQYDAGYYSLNGRYVPYNEAKPALEGYEADILAVLNLPADSYRITDFNWSGGMYTQNGVQYRNATVTGQRYVAEYTSYYSDTVALPDAPGYNATLSYLVDSGETEYTIKATALYEKENTGLTLTQIIVISVVGVFLLIILVVAILFVIAKRKKDKVKGV